MKSTKKTKSEIFFYILIRSWNAFEYFDKCVNSVLEQTYNKYKILYIDDNSNFSKEQKKHIEQKLKKHVVVFNSTRKFSVYNGFQMINKYCKKSYGIVVILDADDWLYNKSSLAYLASFYRKHPDILLSYGECVLWDGKSLSNPVRLTKLGLNLPYPENIVKNKEYRKYRFLPLHPQVFKVSLFKKIKITDLKYGKKWLKYCLDLASFFPMLEMANGRYAAIKRPLYVYNVSSSNLNVKRNPFEFVREELMIRKKKKYEPK